MRLLLVLLLVLGAGTLGGQQVFFAQAASQAADDREDPDEPEAPSPAEREAADPEPPAPADPDEPMPDESDEPMPDESDEPMPWKTDEASPETPETAEDARSEDDEAEGKADDAEEPTADDPEMTDEAEPKTETPAAEPDADAAEPSAEPGPEPDMAEPSAEPAEPVAEAPTDDEDGDEAAIRETINSFLTAFHQGDAKALAAHWTEHGDFVTGSGERWQGQQQIEERYAAYFADTEDARLELLDTQIEVQSPSVAVETGIARVVVPGALPVDSEYKVIHVRTSAGWKIDSVRETDLPGPPSREERLQELGWLVGQWVDHDEDTEIKTTCRWATNQSYLVQTFRVFVEDRVDFEGTQIIGWDPRAEAIRSWTFDSDGGFGAGRWTAEDGRWTVQTLYVLPDGRLGSSTNVYERLADDKVSFSAVGRQVEGKILPNIGPVLVTRVTDEQ
ncbi:MAG: SgcJ/EcaC family oxidoreductase [Pirellulaceae bacterium]|nr:SgcJ/EcaC family oxidoreductase [Pirellulaceae bacterium]